jgi:hypothetical protein
MPPPAPELIAICEQLPAGCALDLACGFGRHALWLRSKGWMCTAVDRIVDFSSISQTLSLTKEGINHIQVMSIFCLVI